MYSSFAQWPLNVPLKLSVGAALTTLVIGFWVGSKQASATRFHHSLREGNESSDDDDDDDDDDDGGEEKGEKKDQKKEKNGVKGSNDFLIFTEPYKMVLVVRTDLGMGKGKVAAQCAHASVACYKSMLKRPKGLKIWEREGQAKITVQAKSEDEILILQAKAMSLDLVAEIIHDAGRTQIPAGSATVLGIVGPISIVDQVTGKLKLY